LPGIERNAVVIFVSFHQTAQSGRHLTHINMKSDMPNTAKE